MEKQQWPGKVKKILTEKMLANLRSSLIPNILLNVYASFIIFYFILYLYI